MCSISSLLPCPDVTDCCGVHPFAIQPSINDIFSDELVKLLNKYLNCNTTIIWSFSKEHRPESHFGKVEINSKSQYSRVAFHRIIRYGEYFLHVVSVELVVGLFIKSLSTQHVLIQRQWHSHLLRWCS